ncbi:tRNA:m(4)X modification enzyme TRM13 homolog [Leptinotarsa decemlineata]|uniref:tRNA:m(4)X modification enzyme TRM13 homolog n=1 Tax=Leptinotarsa decemlineata TaxID=7539 RepID=UPI003D307923
MDDIPEEVSESNPKRIKTSEDHEAPAPSHCKHFVKRKKRYCKMTVKFGEEYCGEHQEISSELSSNENKDKNQVRIPCPLDNKHTCYARNLKKHLKICNARPKKEEPFINRGINSGVEPEDTEDVHKLLSSYPTEQIQKVIAKVNEVYEKTIQKRLNEKISSHKVVEEEMAKPEHGDKSKKHLTQVSSILGLLDEYDLMKPKTCYIEFGAGRGQLSYWIAKACASDKESSILLVEKASPKHKKDNKLGESAEKVCRIRADISDLVLDKLDIITKTSNIVGVTKHLCGQATDLALRCMANAEENREKVGGCVMTFCCHHRCRWIPYTGKEFFKQSDLSSDDFYIVCGMSSWATCGSGLSREKRKEDLLIQDKANERDLAIGLSKSEKEEVGRRSKSVINWGRLTFLENRGFRCHLHYYVDKSITPENACIVAVK